MYCAARSALTLPLLLPYCIDSAFRKIRRQGMIKMKHIPGESKYPFEKSLSQMKSNLVCFSAKTIVRMLEGITNQSVAFPSFHADNIFNVLLVILLPWASAIPLFVKQMFLSPECCKQNFGNQYNQCGIVFQNQQITRNKTRGVYPAAFVSYSDLPHVRG